MRLRAEWAVDLEAMRARVIIVLVKSNQLVKNIERIKNNLKQDFNPFLSPNIKRFSILLGYYIQPSSSSANQNAALIIVHQLDFTNYKQTKLDGQILVEFSSPMSRSGLQFLTNGKHPQRELTVQSIFILWTYCLLFKFQNLGVQ